MSVILTPAAPVALGHRLAAVIATGTHPATGQPLVPGTVCGACVHRIFRPHAGGTVTKCSEAAYRRGGPNLPSFTPACALFTAAEPVALVDAVPGGASG